MSSYVELSKQKMSDFTFGGNALFTLGSPTSPESFTYFVRRAPEEYGYKSNLFNVYLVDGGIRTYLGSYDAGSKHYIHLTKYRTRPDYTWPKSLRVITYHFAHIDRPTDKLIMHHHGRCARCGRKLKNKQSMELGFGTDCYKLHEVGQ